MDTSIQPLEKFDVKLPSRVVYTQYIHYENLPKFCSHCYLFGHLKENCRHLYPPSGFVTGDVRGKYGIQLKKRNSTVLVEGLKPTVDSPNDHPTVLDESSNLPEDNTERGEPVVNLSLPFEQLKSATLDSGSNPVGGVEPSQTRMINEIDQGVTTAHSFSDREPEANPTSSTAQGLDGLIIAD